MTYAKARKTLGTIPEDFPDRFYDFGIAEQNMICAAAGMSALGKVPIVHSPLAAFTTMRPFMRPFEQIRTTVAMNGYNIKIAGLLPGFSAGFQGPTHVALEDIALMREIPGVAVMVPASQEELKEVMEFAFNVDGCVYFRVPEEIPQQLPYEDVSRSISRPRWVKKGKDGLVIAMGSMVDIILNAINSLSSHGLDLGLINLAMLKPTPIGVLVDLMCEYKRIVTVEEHFITGGLGSIIAEVIADNGLAVKLLRVGVNNAFPDRYTTHRENLRYIGLGSEGVTEKLVLLRLEKLELSIAASVIGDIVGGGTLREESLLIRGQNVDRPSRELNWGPIAVLWWGVDFLNKRSW